MAKKPIKSVELLPEFLRTDKNSKFLSSTVDQLIQPPQLERIDGYIGSKLTPTYKSTSDIYISESLSLRRNYQLAPALVVRDDENNVQDVIGFDDLVNEIQSKGGKNNNLDRLFRPDSYSYDPHISWDKLINYQEYYWLVTGPDTVVVTGRAKNTTSTYTVRDNQIGSAFIFNPDGLSEDPLITLYRGNTYHFDVQSQHNFYIKVAPSLGEANDLYSVGVTNNGTSTGVVTLVVTDDTLETLFYISGDQQLTQGQFVIKTAEQDSIIDVEADLIGKKDFVSGTGIKLSNGMKIRFAGSVTPEYYREKEFFVEGVGEEIRLIEYSLLTSSESMTSSYNENFDTTEFDDYPFDSFKNLPIDPEYITINRSSRDLNPWARYNRWFHSDIIKVSAEANGLTPVYPADKRARRPIVEFKPDLKLYNFGSTGITNIDLIDTDTLDAFNSVEGSAGYHVDGVLLQQGHRVVFNADTDSMVRGKIYQVNFVFIDGRKKLQLVATSDHYPAVMSSFGINLGTEYAGTSWWFNGDQWIFSQQHKTLNQFPLFDLFDNNGNSYDDKTQYLSNFTGNRIFGYDVGTGVNDAVLGFPLKYKNSVGVGSYLFRNYFMDGAISITQGQTVSEISTSKTFVKFSKKTGDAFANSWSSSNKQQIPILQFQSTENSTSTINVIAVDNPVQKNIGVEVYIDNNKLDSSKFYTTATNGKFVVNFYTAIDPNTNVLFKLYTDSSPNDNGYYQEPVSLVNNPLNQSISSLTLTELSDHVRTMVYGTDEFTGIFPGAGNLRDLDNFSKHGTRLVGHANPIAFALSFIGKKEHNLVDAIIKGGDQYNQFKMAFLKKISEIDLQTDPIAALDRALTELNQDKDLLSPYYLSDMIAYGTDKTIRTWTVSNVRNKIYPIASDFDLSKLSLRSVLVYLNGEQLLAGKDYEFISNDSSIRILLDLNAGDVITVDDYFSTEGCFVPPTPTKLGLYPCYTPQIVVDDTLVKQPLNMIQGHDGSLMAAYNDFRDDIIIEFERRVYNNIKAKYRAELFDINSVIPGAFRTTDYSTAEINSILESDFIRWAGFYGIDYSLNTVFDEENTFTWNYYRGYNSDLDIKVTGYWRNFYYYFYGTDRPHTHPWEILGYSEIPQWWEDEYGPAPYTSGNEILWQDIEQGYIRQGSTVGVNSLYARPGLSAILPVNSLGVLIDPATIISNVTAYNRRQSWTFGDWSPAETSWRRSSYWPFAVQRLLALTNPSTYAALMYDTSRVRKNIAGQWCYGDDNTFLNLKNIFIHDDENKTLTSGYSVYVSEIGQQRSTEYVQQLRSDLEYLNFNLFHKVGGFISKDKVQLVIDSIDPISTSPGALLPQENYELILNTSNPIKSVGISGIIVQKVNGNFVLKGYDRFKPYFSIYKSIRTTNTPAITVGGISEPYLTWSSATTPGQTGLTTEDVVTASSAPTGIFYQQGQLVSYGNKFYRVRVSHRSQSTFNSAYFQELPSLPVVGGATVQTATRFENDVTEIPYGTEYATLQEVYDVIIGYGKWLENQGFIFDEYNSDFNSVIDWNFSAKEFLYWTTQNWAGNSIITLSPFANRIKYSLPNSVVDNVFDSYYEYSILQANGVPFPQRNLNVTRTDGVCTIETTNSTDGIYFAILNSVQKEHAVIFDNISVFGDTIYNIETGYRQLRMKLSGFRTANWLGDYFSPGFVYDSAEIRDWAKYTNYRATDIVRYNGNYYSALKNVDASSTFEIDKWTILGEKPIAGLLPNFDYKISQFEDFYSLDIDNFDSAQQKMAQHLIGYTPRVYLNNVFTNPIAQYKFYQGFIKEKGTKNAFNKLAKASIHNLQGEIDFNEEWAFRVGHYGAYETYQEIEVPLIEGTFIENPQIINFVNSSPENANDLIYYSTLSNQVITPVDYDPNNTFMVNSGTYDENDFKLSTAGYVRLDDVTATAYSENSLIDIANNRRINENDVIWLGFKGNGNWDVLRYTRASTKITGVYVSEPQSEIIFRTSLNHDLAVGDIVSVSQFNEQVNGVYVVRSIPRLNEFAVTSSVAYIADDLDATPGILFKFVSARFNNFDDLINLDLANLPVGAKFWIDNGETADGGKWQVYEKVNSFDSARSISNAAGPIDQRLGWSINKRKGQDILILGSPGYLQEEKYGKVFVHKKTDSGATERIFSYTLNQDRTYEGNNTPNEFGYSVFYDDYNFRGTDYGLIFAGAPAASYARTLIGGQIAPLSSTAVIPSITLNRNVSVAFQPVIPVDGLAPYTYSISSSLPDGLSFETETGVVSGSITQFPTGVTFYSVTITDSFFDVSTSSFSITVLATSDGGGGGGGSGVTPITAESAWESLITGAATLEDPIAATDLAAQAPNAIYVAKTGNDTTGNGSIDNPYLTITKAASILTPGSGGIIYVREGTYEEVDTINVQAGNSSNWTRIRRYPGETVILDGQGSLRNAFSFNTITANPANPNYNNDSGYVEIHGFNILNYTNWAVVSYNGGSNYLIKNITSSNLGAFCKFAANGYFVTPNANCSNITITNCIYTAAGAPTTGTGMDFGVGECYNITIDLVKLTGPGVGNDTSSDGIALESGGNVTITRTWIDGFPGDNVDVKCDLGNYTLRNCKILQTTAAGRNMIKAWPGDGYTATIENNVLYRAPANTNGFEMLVISNSLGDSIVRRNTIINNGPGYGYTVLDGSGGSTWLRYDTSGLVSGNPGLAFVNSGTTVTATTILGHDLVGRGIFTGSITGNTLIVTGIIEGIVGYQQLTGAGVTANTYIQQQLNDAAYNLTAVGSISGTTLTITSSTGGLLVGERLTGLGVEDGTRIVAYGSGSGDTGTYVVNISQSVSETLLTFWGGTGIYYLDKSQSIASTTLTSRGSTIVVAGTTATTNPPNGQWEVLEVPYTSLDPSSQKPTIFVFTVTNAPTGFITASSGGALPANLLDTYTASMVGEISGTVLTVSSVYSGSYPLIRGMVISGDGITTGTTILSRLTGNGAVGTYLIDSTQTVSTTNIAGTGTVSNNTLWAGLNFSYTGTTVTAHFSPDRRGRRIFSTGTVISIYGTTSDSNSIDGTWTITDNTISSVTFSVTSATTGVIVPHRGVFNTLYRNVDSTTQDRKFVGNIVSAINTSNGGTLVISGAYPSSSLVNDWRYNRFFSSRADSLLVFSDTSNDGANSAVYSLADVTNGIFDSDNSAVGMIGNSTGIPTFVNRSAANFRLDITDTLAANQYLDNDLGQLTDQDGNPAQVSTYMDIGAFERQLDSGTGGGGGGGGTGQSPGVPYQVFVEDWTTGIAVTAGVLTLGTFLRNGAFEAADLAADCTGWEEYGPNEINLPAIGGVSFGAKLFAINAGGVYTAPAYRVIVMMHSLDLSSGMFGDSLQARTFAPPHKIVIKDNLGTVLQTIQMRDGLPINHPSLRQDSDPRFLAANEVVRPRVSCAGSYISFFGQRPLSSEAVSARIPRATDDWSGVSPSIKYRAAVNGSEWLYRADIASGGNGNAHPEVMPRYPQSENQISASFTTNDPELSVGNSNRTWVSARIYGWEHEPGAFCGITRRGGPGGLRGDRTALPAEFLQMYLIDPAGSRTHDSAAHKDLADNFIYAHASYPVYRPRTLRDLRAIDVISYPQSAPVAPGERYSNRDDYYTFPVLGDNSSVRVIDAYGTDPSYTLSYAVTITAVGTVITVAAYRHQLLPGFKVKISGCTQAEYNGLWTVASAPTESTFTYIANTAPVISPATGSPTVTEWELGDASQHPWAGWSPDGEHNNRLGCTYAAQLYSDPLFAHMAEYFIVESASTSGTINLSRYYVQGAYLTPGDAWAGRTFVLDFMNIVGMWRVATTTGVYNRPLIEAALITFFNRHWDDVYSQVPVVATTASQKGYQYFKTNLYWEPTYPGWVIGFSIGSVYLFELMSLMKSYGLLSVLRNTGGVKVNLYMDMLEEQCKSFATFVSKAPWLHGSHPNGMVYIPLRSSAQGAIEADLSTIPSTIDSAIAYHTNPRTDGKWYLDANGTALAGNAVAFWRIKASWLYWKYIAVSGTARDTQISNLDAASAALIDRFQSYPTGSKATALQSAVLFRYAWKQSIPALDYELPSLIEPTGINVYNPAPITTSTNGAPVLSVAPLISTWRAT